MTFLLKTIKWFRAELGKQNVINLSVKIRFGIYGFTGLILFALILRLTGAPIELVFESDYVNVLVNLVLWIALPLLMAASIIASGRLALIIIGLIFIEVPILLISMVPILFLRSDISNINKRGYDASFQMIKEVDCKRTRYRLYRTNGGATTSFGLVLRKENCFLGMKIVKRLYTAYPAHDAELVNINAGRIVLTVKPYNQNKEDRVYVYDD